MARRARTGRRGCGKTSSTRAGRCRRRRWPPSMARQGLQGRSPKRKRRSLTRPDKAAAPIPDLVQPGLHRRGEIDQRWCGDLTEIPTEEGKLYLATVVGSRLAAAGGLRDGRPSRLGARQSGAVHGRRGARRRRRRCDLPHRQGRRVHRRPLRPGLRCARRDPIDGPGRLRARQRRRGELQLDPRARAALPPAVSPPRTRPAERSPRFIDAYNHRRRHSSCEMLPPVAYEQLLAERAADNGPDRSGPREPASQITRTRPIGDHRWHQSANAARLQQLSATLHGFGGSPSTATNHSSLAMLALGAHPPRLPAQRDPRKGPESAITTHRTFTRPPGVGRRTAHHANA